MAWPRAFAVLICAVSTAALVVSWLLLARWPEAGVADTLIAELVLAPSLVLGLVLAIRRPTNRIAPLLCLVGAVPLVVAVLGDLGTMILTIHPGALPVSPLLVALAQGAWMLLYLPAALLMLTFPDGRLLGPRWRWVAAGLLAVPAAFMLLAARDPRPYPPPFAGVPKVLGTGPGWEPLGFALLPAFLGLLLASAAAMIVRYRRASDPVARAQLRWFALGAMLLPVTLLLCWLSYLLFDGPDLVGVGLALTLLAIPAATAVALLRHDLYDVDRAFSGSVTYALVSAALLTVFTVGVVISGLVFSEASALPAAIATALSALALTPLRVRLQRRVDRRLYPLRTAVRSALTGLRERIDAGTAQPEDLEPTLRAALRDPDLRIGYLLPGRADPVDAQARPVRPGPLGEVPVLLGGSPVGVLLPAAPAASRELLREAAAASALLVEVIRSRLKLNAALREVAESRARLLHAGYRERRRLERDLHDGAQQRLVSLGMAIRLAQRHLTERRPDDPVDVNGLLDQAVAELGTAVAELRAIAQGLRPAQLDSGLAPALRSLAVSVPLAVHLDLGEEELRAEPLPEDVATTAYYVACEALANVVKHAQAERIELSVARADGRLLIRVHDDGRGGAAPRPGSGLTGMIDRVAAAGGRLTVGDHRPTGTVVEAVLPCAR
jgi:signal transduction histidine kinase